MLHIVLDKLVASPLEQTQRRGRHVELRHLVLVDDVPVAREVGIRRRALKDDRRDAEQQRRVDDVRVARDPADVAAAKVAVAVVDVKDVLARGGGAEQVAARRMHDALGLASRTRRVEQEQGVLGVDGLGGDVGGPLVHLLVPPKVAAGGPGHVGAGALVDEHVADVGALLEGVVDNLLCADELAAALALVGGDDDLAAGVDDAVAQRVGREASKDDRVDGADARAGQEGDEGLGDHGQVDGDRVALAHAHLLEHVGDLGHLAQQLAVRDIAALAGLVGLVDDGHLVGVLEGVAVDAVERGVELALEEPGIVAVLERAAVHRLKGLAPREQLVGEPPPELLGLGDGLLVELLVLFEVWWWRGNSGLACVTVVSHSRRPQRRTRQRVGEQK